MRYDLTQKELREAVQFYLNEKVLRNPVQLAKVEPQNFPSSTGRRNYVLHVYAHDDESGIGPTEIADVEAA